MALHRFTLFMTVPALVVVSTMCLWLVVLLRLVPSLTDSPVLPFGGVLHVPVAARFISSLDFTTVLIPSEQRARQQRAIRESLVGWDLAGYLSDLGDWPFPPLPPEHHLVAVDPRLILREMLVFDLDDLRPTRPVVAQYLRYFRHAKCRKGYDREALYLNRGAHLHFQGVAAPGASIEVARSHEDPVCLGTHLSASFSLRCRVLHTGLYNVTYHQLRRLNLTISNFLYSAANRPLCHGPCSIPLNWSWAATYHRMVVVPHVLACVSDRGVPCDSRCLEAGFFQAATHFVIDWQLISTLCLVLQLGLGSVLLAVLWPHLRRASSRPPGRLLGRSPGPSYRTFADQEVCAGLPPLFEEAEAARCLAAFVLFGFLGVHRIYRILQDPQLSRSSKALDCLLVFMLGPLFFARDGLCFADFLYEDLIELATVEELKSLELHMANHDSVVVAEQPERNVAYAFFLSPLYWLLLIRVADLCNGNMMGDQVYLSLLGCGLAIFVLWMLSPSSFIVWSGRHGRLIIARQWLCTLQVWEAPLPLIAETHARLEWSSDKILLHSQCLPASQFLQSHRVRLTAPYELLHCLPLVLQLLRTARPPPDLLPPPAALPPPHPLGPPSPLLPSPLSSSPPAGRSAGGGDFELRPPSPLPLELWLQVAAFLPVPALPAFLTTSRAFATFSLLDAFWALHVDGLAQGRKPPVVGMGARSMCYLYHAQRHPERQFSHPVVTTALLPYAGSTYLWRFTAPLGRELEAL